MNILRIDKPVTIDFTSPCTTAHYFFMKQFESNIFGFGFVISNASTLKQFSRKSFASSQMPPKLLYFTSSALQIRTPGTPQACRFCYWRVGFGIGV